MMIEIFVCHLVGTTEEEFATETAAETEEADRVC